jgi:hypothetical protein
MGEQAPLSVDCVSVLVHPCLNGSFVANSRCQQQRAKRPGLLTQTMVGDVLSGLALSMHIMHGMSWHGMVRHGEACSC